MLIFLLSRQVDLGPCKWAFVESASCEGHPEACGPWNGYCSQRRAYLEEKKLQEPKSPTELRARAGKAFLPQIEKAEAEERERNAAVQREFDQWARRKRRERGFERER